MRPSFTENPDGPLIQAFDRGSRQFALLWTPWVKQWSSPQLLRLSEAYLGCRLLHSSTLSGYATRKLRSPAIQGISAIGLFNQALARSVHWPQIDEPCNVPGLSLYLPEYLEAIYKGRRPLVDTQGVAMGPQRIFAAFLGLLPLSGGEGRTIAPEDATAASQGLGGFLRARLPAIGIDWIAERSALAAECEWLPPLLLGETLTPEQLLQAIPPAAAFAQLTEDELWAQIEGSIAHRHLAR